MDKRIFFEKNEILDGYRKLSPFLMRLTLAEMRNTFRMAWLLALVFAGGHAIAQEPPPIPIVHTWGDLQNAPKLTMSPVNPPDRTKDLPPVGPVTFQVGVSNSLTFANGAAVLYFLGSNGSELPYTPEQWGIYWLQVDGVAQAVDKEELFSSVKTRSPGALFYAEAIPFGTAGDHVVELIKPFASDGLKPETREVLARVVIHVQATPPNALWYPFWAAQGSSGGARSEQNPDRSVYAIEPVFNPKGDPAIPKPPRPNWYTAFPAADQALPGLFQELGIYNQVPLKMNDATLIVTFAPKIEGFFPDDYFLTRWWVNDQPAKLDPKAIRPSQSRDLAASASVVKEVVILSEGAIVWYTNEVHFELNFKPEWLGAKKGDKISVQLLYCPSGFMPLDSGHLVNFVEDPLSASTVFSQTSFSQMSNRIAFVYSGDPMHPQQ